ncbi:caspase family protein [Leptothoe sp. LEGE 181152]|nr:caspase family protein [Leptothoe sp. LEGE 181152]
MAKYALLVGVGTYENDAFPALPSVINDIQRVKEVLENEELCNFDSVTVLANPERQVLERGIYNLFADKRPDDVVLMYFSGHGVKNQEEKLFLATPQVEKNGKGVIIDPTAVKATYVQSQMDSSRSKYQVIILDCCFSGAFANDYIPKGEADSTIDCIPSLGGKGRAILTSSSSIESSFEDKSIGLSVYTRYFVEGIESGDADFDRDGRISVDELHRYIEQKIRAYHPQMTPRLYPVEQGYNIFIAKSPRENSIASISNARFGLMLVGNVVDFSNLRGVDQRHVLKVLWDFVIQHPLLARNYSAETDGALDRFIAVWPAVEHQRLIDFACELIEHMQNQRPPTDLKIALHQGWSESITRAGEDDNHLIGVELNECARLARIADADHIILAEEFVRSWANQQGPRVYASLRPKDPENPFEVFAKPYVPQKIFVYRRNRNLQRPPKLPRALRVIDIVRQQLEEVLSEIDDVFLELLQSNNPKLTWETVRPRISIWVPDFQDKNALRSTKYRYLKRLDPDDFNGLHKKPSSTKYRLEGQGQGPPGRCFKSLPLKPIVTHRLADYKQNPEEYIEGLQDFDLPRQTIESLGRHARAFITFPFMLADDGQPGGVVCIDTLSSLEEIDESDLKDIADDLMDFYGSFVATLWELRVGMSL